MTLHLTSIDLPHAGKGMVDLWRHAGPIERLFFLEFLRGWYEEQDRAKQIERAARAGDVFGQILPPEALS